MAKVNPGATQIARVQSPAGTQLPAHLQGRKPMGVETMKEFVILPRLKVIQKAASQEFMADHDTGDLISIPTKLMIAKAKRGNPNTGGLFIFIPLYFYPSWCVLNDFKLKGKEPTYLKYTLDRNDPLVALCKDSKTREQPHPKDSSFKIKNCEQLNFVVLIEGIAELANQPQVMTFMRGDYRQGSDLSSRIRMSNADIFARRWVGRTKFNPGTGSGDFFMKTVMRFEDALLDEAFAKEHGDESPWVTAEQLPQLEALHLQLDAQMKSSGLKGVEDADDAKEEVVASPAGNSYT